MYALVRETTYDPARLAKGADQVNEFQALHSAQPGYAGTVIVELNPGRWLTLNLWASQERAMAALPVMIPAVERLLVPMMVGESRTIGAGTVVLTDLGLDDGA